MKRHHLISALVLAAALLVIPVSSRHITLKDAVETPRDSSVVCVIALDGQPSGSRKIEVNRAMLRQYAKTNHAIMTTFVCIIANTIQKIELT